MDAIDHNLDHHIPYIPAKTNIRRLRYKRPLSLNMLLALNLDCLLDTQYMLSNWQQK